MKKLFTVLLMGLFLAVAGPVVADEAVTIDPVANENASERGQKMSTEKAKKAKAKKNKKKKKAKKARKAKKAKKAEKPAAEEAPAEAGSEGVAE